MYQKSTKSRELGRAYLMGGEFFFQIFKTHRKGAMGAAVKQLIPRTDPLGERHRLGEQRPGGAGGWDWGGGPGILVITAALSQYPSRLRINV